MTRRSWHALLFALVNLASLGAPGRTRAHHVVSESGVAWVEPVTVAQVDLRAASFDFGPMWRGRWWQLVPSLEVQALERLSVSARAPIAFIEFEDGRAVLGLADMELAAKGLVWASEHGEWIVSAGVGAELPTGVEEDALGAGHVELAPFVAASAQPISWLILNAAVSERISLVGEDGERAPTPDYVPAGPHGSVLAPHSDHELFGRLTASALRGESLYVTAGVDGIWMWSGGMDGQRGSLLGRAEVGWAQPGRWRLALGADVPLAGQRRSGLMSRFSAAWMFD